MRRERCVGTKLARQWSRKENMSKRKDLEEEEEVDAEKQMESMW